MTYDGIVSRGEDKLPRLYHIGRFDKNQISWEQMLIKKRSILYDKPINWAMLTDKMRRDGDKRVTAARGNQR